MKRLLIIILTFISQFSFAAIVIEYKVTPIKENPFVEEFAVLPHKVIMTIGSEYVKEQSFTHLSFADRFILYEINGSEVSSCIDGMGIRNKVTYERYMYDIVSESAASYSLLGRACKKIIAEKNGRKLEIYSTNEFGVGFHPNVDIDGIPLLYIEEDPRFERVVYEAVSITVQEVSEDFFDISDYKETTYDGPRKHTLVGKTAKSFKVKDMSGEKLEFTFNDGNIYVLNFWFRGCKPCLQEIPKLNLVVDSLASEKVRFIGISTDDLKVAQDFQSKMEFKYEQYANGGIAAAKYGIKSYPTHVIIDGNGEIFFGSDGFGPTSIYNLVSALTYLIKNPRSKSGQESN